VRSQTTARDEFDRDTYTPSTPDALPSLAMRDLMIAARSDLVADLASELAAPALAASANAITVAASVPVSDERAIWDTMQIVRHWVNRRLTER